MISKKLLSLFFTLLSSYACSAPTNIKSTENTGYVTISLPEQIKNHPIKSTVGSATVIYGLKLIYEGSKTRDIKPDNGAYNLIGIGQYICGGLLTVVGTKALYGVFSEQCNTQAANNDNLAEKNNS